MELGSRGLVSRYRLALLLVATTLLIGCGGSTGAKTGPAAAPSSLSASSSTFDFGNVAVGSSRARGGTLTAGTSAVTISSASWNGQGYSLSGISLPITLTAGESVPFTVTFAPQMSGVVSGSVSFISDASNSPATETLTGMGTLAQPGGHAVALFWSPSPSSVVGYNLYRGTAPGGPYSSKLTSSPQPATGFVDNTVLSGTTYFYVATSVDQSFVESAPSNEITAVIP